jgi:hypothetical protein
MRPGKKEPTLERLPQHGPEIAEDGVRCRNGDKCDEESVRRDKSDTELSPQEVVITHSGWSLSAESWPHGAIHPSSVRVFSVFPDRL